MIKQTLLGAALMFATVQPVAFAADTPRTVERTSQLAPYDVAEATAAMERATRAGAATYAPALYNEASRRLEAARADLTRSGSDNKQSARTAAIEAFHAARAAESVARTVALHSEAAALNDDIARFGGTRADLIGLGALADVSGRGTSPQQQIQYANAILTRAKTTEAAAFAPQELRDAEDILGTAQHLYKVNRGSDTIRSLAYVAEMLARRAEAIGLRSMIESDLPALRATRTETAQSFAVAQAERERAAREAELARMRNEEAMRTQALEAQRARVEAEQSLDRMRAEYQAALNNNALTSTELERLRRQLEDQGIALRSIQERERYSEEAMMRQIESLRTDLQNSRSDSGANAQMLREREAQVSRLNDDLARMRREREEALAARERLEREQTSAIASAEQSRRAAEAEASDLRQRVAAAETRAAAATAELNRTKEQMRLVELERSLAGVVKTRTDTRGLILTLPGIFFDTGKSVLKPGARRTLDRVAAQLKNVTGTSMTIEGHTDSVGSDETNMALSEKRAQAVRDYLVSQGVSAERVVTAGRGESTPIASNTTAAGRLQNRRVELVIDTVQTGAGSQ